MRELVLQRIREINDWSPLNSAYRYNRIVLSDGRKLTLLSLDDIEQLSDEELESLYYRIVQMAFRQM